MYELPACQSTAFCQSLPSVIFCRLYLSAEKCKNYGVIDLFRSQRRLMSVWLLWEWKGAWKYNKHNLPYVTELSLNRALLLWLTVTVKCISYEWIWLDVSINTFINTIFFVFFLKKIRLHDSIGYGENFIQLLQGLSLLHLFCVYVLHKDVLIGQEERERETRSVDECRCSGRAGERWRVFCSPVSQCREVTSSWAI